MCCVCAHHISFILHAYYTHYTPRSSSLCEESCCRALCVATYHYTYTYVYITHISYISYTIYAQRLESVWGELMRSHVCVHFYLYVFYAHVCAGWVWCVRVLRTLYVMCAHVCAVVIYVVCAPVCAVILYVMCAHVCAVVCVRFIACSRV